MAERWLALNREAVNAINVYPVPDGDTGTNMLLTWRAALAAPVEHPDDVGAVLRGVAHGALLGARGNSGVILSQMLRGVADAVDGAHRIGLAELAAALTAGAQAAYDAVTTPVEGTMLTVMRDSAAAAAHAAAERAEVEHMTAALAAEAQRSVERTPELLPHLRDAGVVDAGGLGVALLFAGVHHGLTGTPLPEPLTPATAAVALDAVAHEGHGYCTEYVVLGRDIDVAALEQALAALGGESVLVVGDEEAAHVHVHLPDPGPALSAGATLGALTSVKVDNMQLQHEAWAAGVAAAAPGGDDHPPHLAPVGQAPGRNGATAPRESATPAVGLVAVAVGPGIASAFHDLGATGVVDASGRKPSPGELLAAARAAGRERVYLLPNDADVLMAAEQAAREAAGLIVVVPARTPAAGLAAAVAFLPATPPVELTAAMFAAIEQVRCIEVTRAVRDAVVDGIAVRAGDGIALLDGVLVARGVTLEDALAAALERAVAPGSTLVTLYLGADAPADAEARVSALLAARYPALALEVVPGGQPHYPYLLSVE